MSEKSEQAAIILWFRLQYPRFGLSLRVSQSGGFKGSGAKGAFRMRQAQLQGVVKGEADIAILLPRGDFGCLLLEHKAEGGRHPVTEDQVKYLTYHNSVGNRALSTRGIAEAMAAIREYMQLPDTKNPALGRV